MNSKSLVKSISFGLIITASTISNANTDIQHYIYLGFGELPVLDESFKPAIGYSYQINSHELGFILQAEDDLSRGDNSFNANFGQENLVSSTETTGERVSFQYKYNFTKYVYLSGGLIYGGADIERLYFGPSTRTLGEIVYQDTDLSIDISRKAKWRPAIGIGLRYPLSDNFTLITDFTMDWFNDVAIPDLVINSNMAIEESELQILTESISGNYKSNFHNRYHVFNIGITYQL